MRSLTLSLLVLALAGIATGSARAEDVDPPAFGGAEILFQQGKAPEGWTVGKPKADDVSAVQAAMIKAVAGTEVSEDDLMFEAVGVTTNTGKSATIVAVDVEARTAADLGAAAKSNGWTARSVLSPARWLVVVGDAQAEVMDAQMNRVFDALVEISARRSGNDGHRGAVGYAEAAIALDADAGSAHAALGVALFGIAAREDDDAVMAKAQAELERGLAPDAPKPPKGALAARAHAALGGALLMSGKGPENDAKARDHLAKAVANNDVFTSKAEQGGNHYNYACALARVGEKDAALEHLEKGLALMKEQNPRMAELNAEHARSEDEDLISLRSDPRFRTLLQKYAADKPKDRPTGGI